MTYGVNTLPVFPRVKLLAEYLKLGGQQLQNTEGTTLAAPFDI